MTGYGRGAAERDGWRAVVEIRSVNHRYTDLKLRGSSLDPGVEERVTSAIRKAVERGAITVTVRVDSDAASGGMVIDRAAARRVHHELTELARALHLDQQVSLELICAQPGVIVQPEADASTEALTSAVGEAVESALGAMLEMRAVEGETLARDFETRLDHLVEIVGQLDQLAADAPAEAQRRLEERLSRLLAGNKGVEVDKDRLAQEVAVLADRQDVTEELVRLRSHIDQARAVIANKADAVGRRLGFLVQELGREFNTIGSKSQSAEIARAVVDAKAELEKMREQVQNIE